MRWVSRWICWPDSSVPKFTAQKTPSRVIVCGRAFRTVTINAIPPELRFAYLNSLDPSRVGASPRTPRRLRRLPWLYPSESTLRLPLRLEGGSAPLRARSPFGLRSRLRYRLGWTATGPGLSGTAATRKPRSHAAVPPARRALRYADRQYSATVRPTAAADHPARGRCFVSTGHQRATATIPCPTLPRPLRRSPPRYQS